MSITSRLLLSTAAILFAGAAPAHAAWQPQKPIEFVATAGPGGGTDNLARAVQSIVTKYKLTDQPVVVVNKAGGSGAEGYVYGKVSAGDPYKVIFGTSNAWQQPLVSKVAFNYTDLTPIAAMAQDEFLLWVKQDAPYKTAGDFLKAAASGDFKMGGAQSKDTDEVLTRMIEKAAHVKFTYIPFKSGAEAAVQLAGGHIDSHVNNPSESLGQWRGGTQRPLCAFSPKRLPARTEDHRDRRLERHSDLRRAGPRHLAVRATAHGMAARQGQRRSGRVLSGPHEEGSGDAGVEGLHREDLAGRHLPHRRSVRQVHQRGSRTSAAGCSRAGLVDQVNRLGRGGRHR